MSHQTTTPDNKISSMVVQVIILVVASIGTSALIGGCSKMVDIRDELRDLPVVVANLSSHMTNVEANIIEIKAAINERPTRKEMDGKIAVLRGNVNSDNQAAHAAENMVKKNNNEQ